MKVAAKNEKKGKSSSANHLGKKASQELETEQPLSEKDEVKKAENNTQNLHKTDRK